MVNRNASSVAQETRFYVSLDGDDRWSGSLAAPNRRRTDGPLATIEAAQRAVRKLKGSKGLAGPVRVLIRGGTYFLKRPLAFTEKDSGTQLQSKDPTIREHGHLVTYAAYEGERPVFSGGRAITGFREDRLGGRTVWVADIPDVKAGRWDFRQLWVNGRRARRPRLPGKDLFRIAELPGHRPEDPYNTPHDRFVFREGDIRDWRNMQDVEFVALHFWIDTRRKFKSVDMATRLAVLESPTRIRLTDDYSGQLSEYYVDNVFEAMDEPGQWYLDRPAGRLYYMPQPGETIATAEVIAPVLQEVLRVAGGTVPARSPHKGARRNAGQPAVTTAAVKFLGFEGLTFSHCQWRPSAEAERLDTPQAAAHVPGAVNLRHASRCQFTDCRIEHVGLYGIELAAECSDVELRACTVADVGAGGVKVWHGCRRNTIADCEIRDGGHLWHTGVGVLIGNAGGNSVLHCHIHNFDYSGISVGWTWGYADSGAFGNVVEYNHVHHIGRGVLSDMGGIYTLGVSPGTRIRYNVFHDIESRGYGGWAIYTDEGSTGILIESNLAYRTKSAGFHQHYGRDNIVRNNIFALGREKQVMRSRLEGHDSFLFRNNIVYWKEGELLGGNWEKTAAPFDSNLYFDASGRAIRFADKTLRQWRAAGQDRHSLIADPLFVDPDKGDFRLRKGSPAAKIGFIPFDAELANVGPRKGRSG